jgi:ribosomal protein L37AE/L43A
MGYLTPPKCESCGGPWQAHRGKTQTTPNCPEGGTQYKGPPYLPPTPQQAFVTPRKEIGK